MLSETIVVGEMAVNVYVKLLQTMMELVILQSTWDIICTDSRTGNLVNINLHTIPIEEKNIKMLLIFRVQS